MVESINCAGRRQPAKPAGSPDQFPVEIDFVSLSIAVASITTLRSDSRRSLF